jgi:hypothetical protein
MTLPAQPLTAQPPGAARPADAGRLASLQTVTAELSGARTVAEIGAVTCGAVARAVGADPALLMVLTDDRRMLEVVACSADEGDAVPTRVGIDEPVPAAEAARTRRVTTSAAPTGGLSVALPLVARDEVIGVVQFGWTQRHELASDDAVFLDTIGMQVGQALERARLYDASVETAQLLQRTLLPSQIPATPGLQIAARYQPVDDRAVVGGDFYDVFRRGDGRTFGVSIGDVSGKGVRAASLTALARHTIRAASRRTSSPANVLEELNDAILADDSADRYLTVAHLILQPENMATKVTLSLGGHPQPFLRSADGSVRAIGQPGSAVGLLDRGGQWRDEHLTLAAGNALVLYTDGFTDVRHRITGEFAGDLIAKILADSHVRDAEELADHLLDAVLDFAGGRRRDDMALLVLLPAT